MAPAPLAGLALRAHLEEAAQTALNVADKIIAALEWIDGSDTPQGIGTARIPAQPTLPPRSRRSSA